MKYLHMEPTYIQALKPQKWNIPQVQVHGAQTVKNVDISHTPVFTVPVVFAVIPYALRGKHCKYHWPNFCFLIWTCSYIFHFIVFQATPNLWKLQCTKIVGNPHWQFHRSGDPPSFICSHLFKPQLFTHLHMKIKQVFQICTFNIMFSRVYLFKNPYSMKYYIKVWIGTSIS